MEDQPRAVVALQVVNAVEALLPQVPRKLQLPDEPLGPPVLAHGVKESAGLAQAREGGRGQKSDMRFRVSISHRLHMRERHDEIPEGAQLDEQDAARGLGGSGFGGHHGAVYSGIGRSSQKFVWTCWPPLVHECGLSWRVPSRDPTPQWTLWPWGVSW